MGMLWQFFSFLCLVFCFVCSSDGTGLLHVRPMNDPDCYNVLAESCHTLDEYINQSYNTDYYFSNKMFVFLEGYHELNIDCLINNTVNVTLKSDTNGSVSINCKEQARFLFSDVSGLVIENIAFISCGISSPTDPLPGISLQNLNDTELINVTITNSSAGALYIEESTISIMDILIEKNLINSSSSSPSGMMAANSTVSLFGNNTFTQNGQSFFNMTDTFCEDYYGTYIADSGGVFLSVNNELMINGTLTVTNNISPSGIMIFQNSSITISGEIQFSHNNVCVTGALYLYNTNATLSGEAYFSDNHASLYYYDILNAVAGMRIQQQSVLQIDGKIIFSNNSGHVSSILASDSYISIIGVMMDTNSHGHRGMYLRNTKMVNNGSSVFLDSTVYGSIIRAYSNSIINISGNISFYNIDKITFSLTTSIISSQLLLSGVIFFKYCHGVLYTSDSVIDITGNISFYNSKRTSFIVHHSQLRLSGVIISKNNSRILSSYGSTILIEGNSEFVDNSNYYGGGIRVGRSNLTLQGEFCFERNQVLVGEGGGISAAWDSSVTFQGNGRFVSNKAENGGAIYGDDSLLSFEGNVTFINNSAINGGAIYLRDGGRMELKSQASLTFERNSANKGGAIFVSDEDRFYLQYICTDYNHLFSPNSNQLDQNIPECFISIGDNTTLIFRNNKAANGGSVLYGGMLDNCTDQAESNMTKKIFDEKADENDDSTTYKIYSDPFRLCFCMEDTVTCDMKEYKMNVTRGKEFSVNVAALAQNNQTIQGTVRSYLNLLSLNNERSLIGNLQHAKNECTTLNFTIYSENEREQLVMYTDGPCKERAYAVRIIQIYLNDCPLGLHLAFDRCTCDEDISKYTNSCDIDGIMKVKNAWIMAHENNNYSIVGNCPLDYCMEPPFELNLTDPDDQCNNNRTGMACGKCARNLSLILGSTKCMDCSDNSSLALIMVFAVLGVLLVAVLFLLQLTVANGAINGLILYANIVNANRVMFSLHNTFWGFISWLNLDFGIETCFHDGMNQLAKTAWQFVFPVYLLLLVGAIIVVCHYSIRASNILSRSNPVAVLATIILLSYTKLLQNIIEIFSSASIQLPDNTTKTVWRYDGNVELFTSETSESASWLVLFVVALLVLVVLFLPFTFILFSAQILQKLSPISSCLNRLRLTPFINAYQAPYKPSTRFWIGLCLLVRCIIQIVVAFDEGLVKTLPTILSLCFVLLSTIAMAGGIYSNHWLDVVEVSFILNIGILSALTYYVKLLDPQENEMTVSAVVNLSISVAFIIFIVIVTAQIIQQLKKQPRFNKTMEKAKDKIKKVWSLERDKPVSQNKQSVTFVTSQELVILPDDTCYVELREPVLEGTS